MNTIHSKTMIVVLLATLPYIVSGNSILTLQSMIIITSNDKPLQNQTLIEQYVSINNSSFEIYSLNAIDSLKASINKDLSNDQDAAKRLLQNRFYEQGKNSIRQKLINAYQAQLTAARYQINRYPAVIFDHQWVVYGVTDLQIALQRYQQWKSQQNNTESKVKDNLPKVAQ